METVAPNSVASRERNLIPGVCLMAVNGETTKNLTRRDVLRMVQAGGKGKRVLEFLDYRAPTGRRRRLCHRPVTPESAHARTDGWYCPRH